MLGLNDKLKDLARHGKSIGVAVAGLGQMGLSLASHLNGLKGFKLCAVCDIDLKKTNLLKQCLNVAADRIFVHENKEISPAAEPSSKRFSTSGISKENLYATGTQKRYFPESFLSDLNGIEDIFRTGGSFVSSLNPGSRTVRRINSEVEKNSIVFTNDFSVFTSIDSVDAVIDATGYPLAGGEIAFASLLAGKDLISLNVETDVTLGPLFKKIASKKDAVYTLSAGDEPAVLKELYDFADGLGFKIVCAGKGKNNPLDRYANPATLEEYARSKGSSGKMMTTFVDGTKSMVEMACLSNATGLVPDCRGMHGPHANIKDIASTLCHKNDGGILTREGVVDFVIGDLAPGVFLVYKTDNNLVKDVISYLNLGSGPNYLIYKPYHLTSIETPLSIALAYFERQPWIAPGYGGLVSEVITAAKMDLKAGDIIDGIGGYTVYGLIDDYKTAVENCCLPIGLSKGCVLKRDIRKDYLLTYDDVEFAGDSLLLRLRKIQDSQIQYMQKIH